MPKTHLFKIFSILAILAFVFSSIQPPVAQAQSGDGIRREHNRTNGRLSFIGPDRGRTLPASRALGQSIRPQDPGMALARVYGPEFGLRDAGRELTVKDRSVSQDGRLTVHYQQQYENVPVMGGELIVNTNENGDLYSINGEVSPDLSLPTRPAIDAGQARESALGVMAREYGMSSEDFISTEPVLWIYDESLLRPSTRPAELVWRMEVTAKNNVLPVRELVLVNAEKGTISLHFNQVDTAWHASGLSNVSAQDATPTATPEPAETPVVTETAEPVATTLPVTEEASGLQTDPKSVGSEAVTGVTWYVATTGNNASSCSVKETPCLTIDGALNKASAGDAILVAQGVYSAGSMGGIVVYLTKNVNLSGGWNSSFTAQVGNSTIDGLNSRLGMSIHALVTVIDHFSIQNSKGTYGGGIMSAGGDVTLNHLYIHHNYSSEGGGINQNSGSLVINNSTISENTSSGVGGAVYSQSGSLTINSSTIVRNTAQQGGGYYNYGESIILHNTILANNTAGIGKDCSGAISLSDHSIIGSTAGCTISSQDGDQQNVDPLVAPIAIGAVGYHPLLGGSPAIDAGNPATCTAVDQRSLARPQGAACDIGAYEYTTPSAPAVMSLVDGSNQAAAPNLPFDKPLSVSVVDSQGTPVSGKDVLFTAPGSGPSLAFTGGISQLTVATNGNGIAASSTLTANAQLGAYTVTAQLIENPALSGTFSLRNIAWYVSPSGNDANSCSSPAQPCAHINQAIGKAQAGDVILVAGGEYFVNLADVDRTQVIKIDKSITLVGGWNSSFTAQNGISIVNGEAARRGVNITAGTAKLNRFLIKNGMTGAYGGGVYAAGNASLALMNSTVQSSKADYGGGVYASQLTLENSTISNNVASSHGGGAYTNGLLLGNNNTIAFNSAWMGGGLYVQGNASVKNSILANNTSGHVGADCYGNVSTEGYNLIGSTSGCTVQAAAGDQFNVDPQFAISFTTPQGVLPLKAASPAVNHGNSATCLPKDQYGFSRNGVCDIGAYEYRPSTGTATSIAIAGGDNQRTGLNRPFSKPLQVVTLDSQGIPVNNGLTITFTAPAVGPSGKFATTGSNTASVVTNSDGIATAPAFTANNTWGTYTINASAAGIAGQASFTLTNYAFFVVPYLSYIPDCMTPQTACNTIGGAIDKASPGDTIFVASGMYTSPIINIFAGKNITLSGGWDTLFYVQNGFSYLDGNGSSRNLAVFSTGNKAERFVFQNGYGNSGGNIYISPDAGLTLSNVTVRGGRAEIGGGITINGGSLTLVNSTVTDNTAVASGGGIYIQSGSLTSEYSTIASNTAATAGGGLSIQSGSVTLNSSILGSNQSPVSPDCQGMIAKSDRTLIANMANCAVTTVGVGNKFNVDPQISSGPVGSIGYHGLKQTSPAIGAGDTARCPAKDARDISRPQNSTCDAGSYEYITPGAAASFGIVSGSNQKTAPLTAFPFPFKIYAMDSAGSPVPGVQVTFTAPGSGASGKFSNNTTTAVVNTDDAGVAAAPVFTANIVPGSYTVTATVAGLPGSAAFSLTNNALYVNPVTGNDTNTCRTPAAACRSIAEALWKANWGDLILLASGTYTGLGPNEAVANIEKSVSFSGGWDSSFLNKNGISVLDAQNSGRGIFVEQNVMTTINRVKIINCQTPDAGYIYGGGVFNRGTLVLEDSNLLNCRAYNQYNNYRYGGGIYNSGSLTLNRVSITGGTAALGGGIYQDGGQLKMTDVTISGNTAESGGGLYIANGTTAINNATLYQNVATAGINTAIGGGIANPNNRSVSMQNTILAGNAAEVGSNCAGNLQSQGHNLISIADACTVNSASGDLIGKDGVLILARLGDLGENGGLSLTNALLTDSPAIDAGNPATCAATDQRGVARPQGSACDIGAFEGTLNQVITPVIKTYTANHSSVLPGTFVCDQATPGCTGNTNPDADAAHKFAIGTYNLYKNRYGRLSMDNNNMPVLSTVQYQETGEKYDNAFWSGAQMVYGDAVGYARADDVAAHELTHGVTQYESNLFYYYQSGAINESFSDLWGEYYDQDNGLGNDTAGIKWRLGEDIAGLVNPAPWPSLGLRDMKDPTLFDDPDRMSSPNYYEGPNDNGGVHWNSGVNNKAVYLMVDGGTFSGITVTPLTWDKVGAIYYEAQTNLLTSGADYSDLYYALQQACTVLVGEKGITAGDCAEVEDALNAVEMNGQPSMGYNPDAPLCTTAGTFANTVFADDLENGTANWTFNNGPYERWQHDSPYGQYAQSGSHFLYADDYPGVITDASAQLKKIAIPAGAYLWFAHAYDFQTDAGGNYDGGVLEYSTNDGATWTDAGPLMDSNYPGVVSTKYSNPLGGRQAFVGRSHGYISTRLDLSPLAGQTVSFRWRMGLDSSKYVWGWWLDNVKLFTCPSKLQVSIGGSLMGSYDLQSRNVLVKSYGGIQNGPVKVASPDNKLPLFTSERVISGNSFNEVMGYPTNQLTTEYWFPWYDNVSTATWLLVGNPTTSTAKVDIYIGGVKRTTQTIQAGGRVTPRFALQMGPVRVVSTNGVKIFSSERTLYGSNNAFNEVMGYPANQLTTEYWFPWYDNTTMDTWLLVGNPSTTSTAAVEIYIGTKKVGTYSIPKGGRVTPRFNLQDGPVRVVSTNGVKIFSSERTLAGDSFNEVMGYPASQFTTEYWYPWYDNVNMATWILVGNPTDKTAYVDIYIGGVKRNSYSILKGERITPRFDLNTGPVRVVSTNGVKIFTSQRVLYGTSFNEVMGYPGNKLTTEYWFPWYDSETMSTDILVGRP